MYDVIVVGGGVVGTNIARALAMYELEVLLLEAENDVSMGASKANSAIVHGGYSESYQTLKGHLAFLGRAMFAELEEQLHFGFAPIGSLVVATHEEQKAELERLQHNGVANGLTDLTLLDHQQVLHLEPHINPDIRYALHCAGAGICSPYEFTIAMMENAVENGVQIKCNHKVCGIQRKHGVFVVQTGQETEFRCRYLVNAAGLGAGAVGDLVGVSTPPLHYRSGQYILFEAGTGNAVRHTIFQTPGPMGKGILVSPTVHGNLMIGPDAIDEPQPNYSTDTERLYHIYSQALHTLPGIDLNCFLRSFAGVRTVGAGGDFTIKEAAEGFIHLAGIQSPGLTAAPAIALHTVGLLQQAGLVLHKKQDFHPNRTGYPRMAQLPKKVLEERLALPLGAEGRMVCRCEQVPEATMRKVLAGSLPITSLDAMKRRTRCSMGQCQGFFCKPRTKELMEQVLGVAVPLQTDIEVLGAHRVSKEELLAHHTKVLAGNMPK